MDSTKNERIFISGANRGLGLALTANFLERGWKVFAGSHEKTSKDLDGLSNVYPGQLVYFELELGSDTSVSAMAQALSVHTKSLDIIMNNGAILGDIETEVPDLKDFDLALKVMDINAIGALRVNNALYGFLEKGARKLIVNVSSEAGSIERSQRSGWYAYCMSKAALNMQTQLLHNKIFPIGGQAMSIHPGWVQTYMQGHKDERAELTAEEAAQMVSDVVLGHRRFREPQAAFVDYRGMRWPW